MRREHLHQSAPPCPSLITPVHEIECQMHDDSVCLTLGAAELLINLNLRVLLLAATTSTSGQRQPTSSTPTSAAAHDEKEAVESTANVLDGVQLDDDFARTLHME